MGCGNSGNSTSPAKVVVHDDKIGNLAVYVKSIKPNDHPKSMITVPLKQSSRSTRTTHESEKSITPTTANNNRRSSSPAETRTSLGSPPPGDASSSSSSVFRRRSISPSGVKNNVSPSSNRSSIASSPASISRPLSPSNKQRRKSDLGPVANNRPASPSANKPRRKSDLGPVLGSRPASPNTSAQKTPPKRRNSSAVPSSTANSRTNSRPVSPRNQRRNSKSSDEYNYVGDKCHQRGSALQYHEYGRYHLSDIHDAVAQAKRALEGSHHGLDDNDDDNEEVKPKGKFHKDAAHRKRSL